MPEPIEVPAPSHLIGQAIARLGCTTLEARARIDRRTRASANRVVVSCPDRDTWFLLGALVEALGGVLERNPRRLALGIAIPDDGVTLTFIMPWDHSTAGPLQLG